MARGNSVPGRYYFATDTRPHYRTLALQEAEELLLDFVYRIINPGLNCPWGGVNADGPERAVDVAMFINALLNKTPCP